ncbi:DUF4262 domain-containing protein [Streptomyces sp. NPDC001407]|uniref:DUF4262 domain-containing protein n=1 Tax=Streptomyces sp. NPDC001407 TaxID=3364573 RepID=UPI0036C7136E
MGSNLADFMQGYLLHLAHEMAEHGYVVQSVEGDEYSVPYSYTVGLHQSRGYELVMTGVPRTVAEPVLHNLVERFAHSAGPEPGVDLDGVLGGGYRIRMRRVDSLVNFAILRALFGEDADPPYWQAVWPDPSGIFPGAPGCSLTPAGQPHF